MTFSEFIDSPLFAMGFKFFIHIIEAIGILLVGWILARWAERTTNKMLSNKKGLELDDTFRPLISNIVRYTILLAAVYAALTTARIPASSILAVFGAAGLAIALAVKGTLSNVVAGLMLIFLRAIKIGEYIQTPDFEGTVLEIGLFTTGIKTADGVFMTVPNSRIWATQIKNYSRYKVRRIDILLELDRDNDIEKALAALLPVLQNHQKVISDGNAEMVILGFTPTTVQLQARCWLKANELRASSSQIRLTLHEVLRKGRLQNAARKPRRSPYLIPVNLLAAS